MGYTEARMKTLKKLVHVIFLLLSGIYIKLNFDLAFINPYSMSYGAFVYATMDNLGNKIIIDSSGNRLLKVNSESGLEFLVNGKKKSDRGFYEARKAITDKDNNIYVLNILKEDGSYRINREEIIKYSPAGKYLGVVFAVDHEEPLLVGKIIGLYNADGKLAYIMNEDDYFTVYNEDNTALMTCKSVGTRYMTVSYAIDPKTNDIYYSTKKGFIYKYNSDGEDQVIFDANQQDYLSIPRELSLDSEGNLYFTDIGLRTVSMISPEGELSHVIYEEPVGEDIADKYIYYYCDATNGIITVSSDYIAYLDNGEIIAETGWSLSSGLLMKVFSVWGAVLVFAAILLYWLIKGANFVLFKGPTIAKFATGIISGVIGITCLFLLIILPDFKELLLDSILERAQVISDIAIKQLPFEEFKSLDSTDDFMSDEYIAVRDSINGVFLDSSESISDFYCVLYTIRDNVITCSYSLQEDSGAIYPYDWPYEGSDEQWIVENKEGLVYRGLSSSEGTFLFVLNPILDESDEVIGLIEVGVDLNSINKETNMLIYDLFLNIVVISVVIVLIAWEIIVFVQGRKDYKKLRATMQDRNMIQIPSDLMRILVFGIFFITNMTTSFLPIYAMNIAQNSSLTMILKEVLAAIPISAEVLFGAIFSVLGTRLIFIFGNKKTAILGSSLFTAGLFIRFLLPNIWILTLGNAIMGTGWGILLLIVNTVIASGTEDEKNKGFAGYSAAALNGVNCGIVFGGFLINWLSYSLIFLFATVLSILVFIHVVSHLNKANYSLESIKGEKGEKQMSFWKFITSKGVLGYFMMIVVPVISCGYFLNYMFPILGYEYGLSETNIGYSYLINGLCVICLSNTLTKKLSKLINKANSLVLSSLIYAAAFVCVAYFENIYALLAVLILLGISDSFGLPMQTSYYTDLDAVKQYGYERAMGIYSLFENIAQTGGSYVFSCVLLAGVKTGLYIVVAIIVTLTLLFGFLNLVRNRKTASAA